MELYATFNSDFNQTSHLRLRVLQKDTNIIF